MRVISTGDCLKWSVHHGGFALLATVKLLPSV
jgi:hypothetical protein